MVGMRKLQYICATMLALGVAPLAFPQVYTQPRLLPTKVGDWKLQQCVDKPAAPSLASEANLKKDESCSYVLDSHTFSVAIQKYKDPSSAYEIYTSQLSPEMSPSILVPNSAIDEDKLVVLVGDFVLQISSPRTVAAGDLQDLIKGVRANANPTPLPPVRTYLPEEGMVSGTQRYALGPEGFNHALESLKVPEYGFLSNELGFSKDEPETMLAQYQFKNNSGVMLLVLYPTPQLAELHLHHLKEALKNNGQQDKVIITSKASLLSMVLNPSSAKYAEFLRKSANYETQVTWNEPSHELTDPPITSTLVKIFIGTGVFMMVATVLGIAFGGVRVITKKLFPGKVFDRPEQIEVLQLGLSGKKIDPTDFY